MATLIKDLLTFSRIATRQDIKNPVSLHSVFDAVLTDLKLVIQETGAVVDVADLPTVTGDRAQLTQLLQNLGSNALKFRRPDTPVHIRITSQRVQASELPTSARLGNQATAYARIDVTDNGIGFDTKYLDRIFEVFQRLHSRAEYDGTGIGLAICQKVVADHSGFITATSQPG